jgi:hypothetical protein
MYTDYDLGEPLDEGAFATLKEKMGRGYNKAKQFVNKHNGKIGAGLSILGGINAARGNIKSGALMGGLGYGLLKAHGRKVERQKWDNMSHADKEYTKYQALKKIAERD